MDTGESRPPATRTGDGRASEPAEPATCSKHVQSGTDNALTCPARQWSTFAAWTVKSSNEENKKKINACKACMPQKILAQGWRRRPPRKGASLTTLTAQGAADKKRKSAK